jgi:hypothetical protein
MRMILFMKVENVMKKKEEELPLMPYSYGNGILIYCCNPDCYSEFEETANGYYSPIKYESDKHNRKCRRCLIESGYLS